MIVGADGVPVRPARAGEDGLRTYYRRFAHGRRENAVFRRGGRVAAVRRAAGAICWRRLAGKASASCSAGAEPALRRDAAGQTVAADRRFERLRSGKPPARAAKRMLAGEALSDGDACRPIRHGPSRSAGLRCCSPAARVQPGDDAPDGARRRDARRGQPAAVPVGGRAGAQQA